MVFELDLYLRFYVGYISFNCCSRRVAALILERFFKCSANFFFGLFVNNVIFIEEMVGLEAATVKSR